MKKAVPHTCLLYTSIPIYRDNEIVGIVGMDIDFSIIEDVIKGTRVYDSGYAFLVDAKGTVMYHKEIPMGKPMASADESLVSVVAELENGTTGSSLFSYKWKGDVYKRQGICLNEYRNGWRRIKRLLPGIKPRTIIF